MATFRLKDAGAAGRKSGGVRMQSMHTIDPIACSDSVRRTDAHVRPSTRWETEDVGGSSWAPLRSPNRSPRLSIHRPASVREDLRPLATGGHVPRLSPRMRRLYRYTMCTRSPKPRASPCRSCCLGSVPDRFETRRCVIASVTIVSAGSRERVSMVSPKTRARLASESLKFDRWNGSARPVLCACWRRVAVVPTAAFARVLGNRRSFVAAIQ